MITRAGDVLVACPHNHAGRGGSIPTPALFFHAGMIDDATDLVMHYHYSRRWPSNVQFVGTFHDGGGLFGTCGDAVAGVVFSIPPTRWAEPVLELSRLVRADGRRVALSRLIKIACVHLKRAGTFDLLVSFADWTQRHHGGVYQASGWNYNGQRDSQNDGLIVDGVFWPGRSCNSRWGTRSADAVREILGAGHTVEPHYDDGKHLYWKALTRSGLAKAERLGLTSSKYPKPWTKPGTTPTEAPR